MVKTIVTPDHSNIELSVPESYIGKKVEVLMYTIDEIQVEIPQLTKLADDKKPSQYGKILSDELVEQYHEHIKQSREGWQNRF